MQGEPIPSEDIELFTDASGLGLGCVFGHQWAFAPWTPPWDGLNINVKEIFAVWVAVAKQIIIYSDNMDTVKVWYQGCKIDKDMLRVLRKLFFFTAS